MKNTYMSLDESNKFKGYMVRAGFNITSLAQAVGMSREMLSMRISGKVDFGRTEMNDIAKVLKIPPNIIFFDNEVTSNVTKSA